MTDSTHQDDQDAAARREAGRAKYKAWHNGQEVTLRTVTVVTDPSEMEALERGEMPDSIQAQVDRQLAEDATIVAMDGLL